MNLKWMKLVPVIAIAVSCAAAQDAPAPTATPAPTAGTPATPPGQAQAAPGDVAQDRKLTDNSTADETLEALHAVGLGLQDFTAHVTLTVKDAGAGDSTSQAGVAYYQKKGEHDGRMRVIFETNTSGGATQKARQEYLLDNGWLTERDYNRQTEVLRQVLKPGEKMDLLKLGEGPFPLPIGQPKEDVYKLFDVTKPAPSRTKSLNVPGTVRLTLKPKEGTQFANRFSQIDVWVDQKTNFPKRIDTIDENQAVIRSTDLDVTAKNSGIGDKEFALEKIPANWNQHTDKFSE
jgi:hypothetical protein